MKITGDEPTLHSRFLEIIEVLSNLLPNAQKVVNTNAYPFVRVKKVIDESLRIDRELIFSLSLDGIGEKHDFVRGVKGCFPRL